VTFLPRHLGTLFLSYSLALLLTLVLCNLPGALLTLFIWHLLAFLTWNLGFNLVSDSAAVLLGNSHAHISLDIMALLFRDSVRHRLINSAALFLVSSLALLLGNLLTLLSWNLFAFLPWHVLAHFLGLVAAVLLGHNLRNLILYFLAGFSRHWSADRYIDRSTFFNSFIVSVLLGNTLALLPWYIVAFLSRLVPALLLGNIIADHVGNIMTSLTRFIPAFFLGNLVADLLGFIPALLLWHIVALHSRDICALLPAIVINADWFIHHIALSGLFIGTLLLSDHVALLDILHLALPLIDHIADLLLVLMTFLLILRLALLLVFGITFLVVNGVAFLLMFDLGHRFLDLLAFHLGSIIAFILQVDRTFIPLDSFILCFINGLTNLFLLSVALLVILRMAFLVIFSMTVLLIFSVAFLLRHIHTLHLRNIMGSWDLDQTALRLCLLMAFLFSCLLTFFTRNVVDLGIVHSIAVLAVLSVAVLIVLCSGVRLLHSVAVLAWLVPTILLVHSLTGGLIHSTVDEPVQGQQN